MNQLSAAAMAPDNHLLFLISLSSERIAVRAMMRLHEPCIGCMSDFTRDIFEIRPQIPY